MRLRSSSRCSMRLMPGSSARSVTALRAFSIASCGSTMVGGRLRSFGFRGGALRGGCGVSWRGRGGRFGERPEEFGLLRGLARRIGGDDFTRRWWLNAQTGCLDGRRHQVVSTRGFVFSSRALFFGSWARDGSRGGFRRPGGLGGQIGKSRFAGIRAVGGCFRRRGGGIRGGRGWRLELRGWSGRGQRSLPLRLFFLAAVGLLSLA